MVMGAAAAERCDDFGWHPRGAIDTSLVAEIAQTPRFGAGHAWSHSAQYALTEAPERSYLVLTMEGGFDFTIDGTPVRTEPGSLIVLQGDTPTLARTLGSTARFVWHLEPTVLRPEHSRFAYGEPFRVGGTALQGLMAMTNGMVRSLAPVNDIARRHLALAFEHLLVGVIEESGPQRNTDLAAHHDGLFMAAVAVIETRFRDPGLSVERIAKDLAVSVRTLHATFARTGTSPRREIERRRVAEAGHLADLVALTPSELATRCGFTSVRQMTRSLGRQPGADPGAGSHGVARARPTERAAA